MNFSYGHAANVEPFFATHGEDITVNGQTIQALADVGYSFDERNPERRQKNVDRSFTIRTTDKGNISKGNIVVHEGVQYQVLTTPADDGMGLTSFQVMKGRLA